MKAGPGRPKGHVTDETKAKQRAMRAWRLRAAKMVSSLMNAQLSLAMGSYALYQRGWKKNPDGTKERIGVKRIEDPAIIEQYLNGELSSDDYYYLELQRPHNDALDSILDRAFGRPVTVEEGAAGDAERRTHEIKITVLPPVTQQPQALISAGAGVTVSALEVRGR